MQGPISPIFIFKTQIIIDSTLLSSLILTYLLRAREPMTAATKSRNRILSAPPQT